MKKIFLFTLLIAVLEVLVVVTGGYAQASDAPIKNVSMISVDGLKFEAWLAKSNYAVNEKILIRYRIVNQSKMTQYLLEDPDTKWFKADGDILYPRPFVPTGGHEPYKYHFRQLNPKAEYESSFVLNAKDYQTNATWCLNLGFGYVSNIKGLTPRKEEIKDPAPFKALLDSRLKTIGLYGLRFELMNLRGHP